MIDSPIVNDVVELDVGFALRDRHDDGVILLAPKAIRPLKPVVQQGELIASFSGELTLKLHGEDYDAVREHFGAEFLVRPVGARVELGEAALGLEIPEPHQVNLSVVNHIPYPSLSVSILIYREEAGADALLERIVEAWSLGQLVSWEVVLAASGVEVLSAASYRLSLQELVSDLRAIMGEEWFLTPGAVHEAINASVAKNWISWSNRHYEGEGDRLVKAEMARRIHRAVAQERPVETCFDDETCTLEYGLRRREEFDANASVAGAHWIANSAEIQWKLQVAGP